MSDTKVVKAVVEPEFKNKVLDRAKKEGRTERSIVVKALKNYLETPLKK